VATLLPGYTEDQYFNILTKEIEQYMVPEEQYTEQKKDAVAEVAKAEACKAKTSSISRRACRKKKSCR
jgi:hypothetical protein